jgi:hypothetical protein
MSGPLNALWRFDSETGALLGSTQTSTGALALAVAGSDPESSPLLLSVGLDDITLVDPKGGSSLWQVPVFNRGALRLGALMDVAGDQLFAAPQGLSPVLHIIDAADGTVATRIMLAGGQLHDTDAAVAAPLPELSNVTALNDLTGAGTPAWLVGATDGFLYAVDAATNELLWNVDLGAPVGEVVPVDWDGDGLLELVVSAADGFLYGIAPRLVEMPAWVQDVDPGMAGDGDAELAIVRDTLHARWAPVSDARAYQVGVFAVDGEVIAPFADAGNATNAVISGLPLESGRRYVVAVRAVSTKGMSADAVSNGITVIHPDDEGIAEEPTSDCGCRVASSEAKVWWLAWILLTVAWWKGLRLVLRPCRPRRRVASTR